MISQSKRERERYESYLKLQRDIYTAVAEGRDEGRDEGRTEIQVRRIQSLQRLLRQEIGPPDKLQSLSICELENLAVQLEKQLDAKLGKGL
jgi:hypothetical protein